MRSTAKRCRCSYRLSAPIQQPIFARKLGEWHDPTEPMPGSPGIGSASSPRRQNHAVFNRFEPSPYTTTVDTVDPRRTHRLHVLSREGRPLAARSAPVCSHAITERPLLFLLKPAWPRQLDHFTVNSDV